MVSPILISGGETSCKRLSIHSDLQLSQSTAEMRTRTLILQCKQLCALRRRGRELDSSQSLVAVK